MVAYSFLFRNTSVHIILVNLKKIQNFLSDGKKIYMEACTKPVLWVGNYDCENNDRKRTLYVHVVLNGVIFPQILYDIVPYA